MESVTEINSRLKDLYGLDVSVSLPNYRIVWTTFQYETRHNEAGFDIYSEEGRFLRTEYGPKEVEKYPLFDDMWVLEVLMPKPAVVEKILVDDKKYSYEPLFIFGAGGSNAYPIWRAVDFLVRAHRFKINVMEKKTPKDLLIEEMKAIAKEKEICKQFLSNENPPLATALSAGEAIVVPGKLDSKEE